jgi:hypothetical protein
MGVVVEGGAVVAMWQTVIGTIFARRSPRWLDRQLVIEASDKLIGRKLEDRLKLISVARIVILSLDCFYFSPSSSTQWPVVPG